MQCQVIKGKFEDIFCRSSRVRVVMIRTPYLSGLTTGRGRHFV